MTLLYCKKIFSFYFYLTFSHFHFVRCILYSTLAPHTHRHAVGAIYSAFTAAGHVSTSSRFSPQCTVQPPLWSVAFLLCVCCCRVLLRRWSAPHIIINRFSFSSLFRVALSPSQTLPYPLNLYTVSSNSHRSPASSATVVTASQISTRFSLKTNNGNVFFGQIKRVFAQSGTATSALHTDCKQQFNFEKCGSSWCTNFRFENEPFTLNTCQPKQSGYTGVESEKITV